MEFGFISSPNDSVFCLQSHWNNIGRGLKIKLLEILHFRGWEMRKERWWRHERRNSIRKMGFTVFQSLSHIWLFATPWSASCQTSLSFTLSQSLLKLMFIESVMPSNHLTLCYPFFLLSSIFPTIRVFSNELALRIRWPKYWSFNISPSNE